ncbi:MAG TPA: MFS transporter [Streptosporangiaceae bacterium]|nr:MFS transporter [Streptosporangiaceae bacterium]
MADPGSASSSWAPLRIGLFRALWIAALVSNVGTWMQTVGAQWLLVQGPHASVLVSLVQTANTLPAVLFALVGGVLADIFDRVKLLVAVLAGMTAAGGALTALTAAHRMPPALLLMFTFVLGTGAILVAPAYQSLVPDMVPRPLVPAASALSSISINLARAIGPAIAGLLVARVGVAAVFGLNAATFLLYAVVVACHPQLGGTPPSPERFIPGLRAGGRYMRHAPVVQRILLRTALFLVPGSSLWALLPLIATRRLALGSGGYGVLLGALGVGAIGGAFILPQARARLSANALVAVASLTYAAVLAAVALSRNLALTVLVLLPAGVAWIAFLSNVNAALQLFLPKWVRARGLAAYQMVLFGAQAAGAALWGVVAGAAGLVPAFLISAAVMAAGAATLWFWPFHEIADMDRSLVRWPEPQLLISPDRGNGLVLVRTTYTIAAEKEQQFLQAMARLRKSRLRTGATDWALYQDGQNPRLFIELFGVPSWEEHLRQHRERQTGTDLQYHDDAAALSDPRPQTDHYLAADVRE